ncbi:MAG: response regulator transcription factor [Phycisphaerae bacterium]|nr:response regulator transcription factor [Phycisphaerae bacterium]
MLCVDDNADLAGALCGLIGAEADMCSVGAIHSASDLLASIEALKPDVVIVDLTMDGTPPLDAVRAATDAFPKTRTIVYSGYDDVKTVDQALDAGAWGFVSKHDELDEIIAAIRAVKRGELVVKRR